MKLDVWCDGFDSLKNVKTVYLDEAGEKPLTLKSRRVHGNFLLITLEGVESLEDAMRYKTKQLYADRANIPKADGAYFIADLIGLEVIDEQDGRVYGTISDVINRGASDIYVVNTPSGERMMPVVDEFVKRVDIDKGVFVHTIPGLLSDD